MREMPTFKTLKGAERYGEKNYFMPKITSKYSRKHGTFLGWEVKDLYDEKKKERRIYVWWL